MKEISRYEEAIKRLPEDVQGFRLQTMDTILGAFDRILLTGFPETGKTSLSRPVSDRLVIHLDDLVEEFGHSECVRQALLRMAGEQRYLIEGTQGVRLWRFACRNDLFKKPRYPLEALAWCFTRRPPEAKHANFNKGQRTMWREAQAFKRYGPAFYLVEGRPED